VYILTVIKTSQLCTTKLGNPNNCNVPLNMSPTSNDIITILSIQYPPISQRHTINRFPSKQGDDIAYIVQQLPHDWGWLGFELHLNY